MFRVDGDSQEPGFKIILNKAIKRICAEYQSYLKKELPLVNGKCDAKDYEKLQDQVHTFLKNIKVLKRLGFITKIFIVCKQVYL